MIKGLTNNICLLIVFITVNNQFVTSHDRPNIQLVHKRLLQSSNLTCTQPQNFENFTQLGNCQNLYYIMGVQIGTPGQYLNLVIDTQVSLIALQINQTQSQFKPLDSSTLEMSSEVAVLQLNNGDNIYGLVGSDQMRINQNNQTYLSVDSLIVLFDQPILSQYSEANQIGGIIGLSYSNINPNFLQAAQLNKQLQSSAFALSLKSNQSASYIYYNQIPQQISQNTYYMKFYNENNLYQIDVIGFYIENEQYLGELPNYVVLSTTNPYFSLSQSIHNKVMQNYFKTCLQTQTGMNCSCFEINEWPTFSIMLNGLQIYLQPSTYIQYIDNQTCSFGFDSIPDNDRNIILGLSFFYSYNITFDPNNKKVGLQGNLTLLQQVGESYLASVEYFMCAVIFGISLFSLFLIWYLRIMKQYKPSIKFIEFGISDRFIQN